MSYFFYVRCFSVTAKLSTVNLHHKYLCQPKIRCVNRVSA